MRAYIEINGIERIIETVAWSILENNILYITVPMDENARVITIFSKNHENDNLSDFLTAELVHTDLQEKVYWRESK